MKLVPVAREEVPQTRTRESTVSAEAFRLVINGDAGSVLRIDLEEGDKSPESVRSTFQNYANRHNDDFIREHNAAVKVFARGGAIYLERITPEAWRELEAKAAERKANREAEAEAESEAA